MRRRTREEVERAAHDEEGFCLACGEQAECPEIPGRPAVLCDHCDRYEVLSARAVLRVLALVEDAE